MGAGVAVRDRRFASAISVRVAGVVGRSWPPPMVARRCGAVARGFAVARGDAAAVVNVLRGVRRAPALVLTSSAVEIINRERGAPEDGVPRPLAQFANNLRT